MVSPDIQVYELYDLWYQPLWKHPYAIIGLMLIGSIVLYFIARWWQELRKRRIIQDPWQEAISQLQALDLTLFHEHEMHKIFYSYLTAILKKYLSKRYQLDLNGKTDQEVVFVLANSGFPRDLSGHLEPILQGAVIIKFSNQDAAQDRMRYDLMHSIDIVRNTIPLRQ